MIQLQPKQLQLLTLLMQVLTSVLYQVFVRLAAIDVLLMPNALRLPVLTLANATLVILLPTMASRVMIKGSG